LERATEARTRLLRGVTHDVKNPLGAAKGYAELLQMGVKTPMLPEQAPLVAGVIRSIDGALAIIADLLDVARADSAGLAVNRVEVDLAVIAREAAEAHRPAAESVGHVIEVVAQDPLNVFTDPDRVTQVLGNLLSNAIKYTPTPGRITVTPDIRDGLSEMGGPWAIVQVMDNGPGIPVDQRDAIFDEFTRLDDTGPQTGHGLGLAIARRIARLLGGDLNVEPADDRGANFILRLPLRDHDAPPQSIGQVHSLREDKHDRAR
jgi:signal transduction histidine kinase